MIIYHLSYLAYFMAGLNFACAIIFPIYIWKLRKRVNRDVGK